MDNQTSIVNGAAVDDEPARSNHEVMNPPNPLDAYIFPTHRLKRVMDDSLKEPVVFVCCGSFSPITCLHLRVFELAADYIKFNTEFEVVGGYLSPVSDAYKKQGLASAQHRLQMCQLAADEDSKWLMVDPWETIQNEYQPTTVVLDHFNHTLNAQLGGIQTADGNRKPITVILVAGADLIQTMSNPGLWTARELEHILGRYLTVVIERSGTDMEQALSGLSTWRDRIHIVNELFHNDVSSTKIRLCLRKGMSVRYLIPACIITYIQENGLYQE